MKISSKPSFTPLAILVAALVLAIPAVSSALFPSQVTLNFMCPCGSCDEALSTCECPSSDDYRAQIAGMIGRGSSEDQIIQDFVARFGPQVLVANAAMAPNSSGRSFDNRTVGIVLLIASFTLAAFGIGRYMGQKPVPARARQRSGGRPNSSSRSSKDEMWKKARSVKRTREESEDDYLDDSDII